MIHCAWKPCQREKRAARFGGKKEKGGGSPVSDVFKVHAYATKMNSNILGEFRGR